MRNCTRDEGRSFEFGNQVLISRQQAAAADVASYADEIELSGKVCYPWPGLGYPKPAEPEPNRARADNTKPQPCGQILDVLPIYIRPCCSRRCGCDQHIPVGSSLLGHPDNPTLRT